MKKVKKIVMMVLLISVMGCEQHNDVPLPPRPALVMEVGSIENQNDSMVLVGEVPLEATLVGDELQGLIEVERVEVQLPILYRRDALRVPCLH